MNQEVDGDDEEQVIFIVRMNRVDDWDDDEQVIFYRPFEPDGRQGDDDD